jgi:hypothetical protein
MTRLGPQGEKLRKKLQTESRQALRPPPLSELPPVETSKQKLRRLIREQARPALAPWRH